MVLFHHVTDRKHNQNEHPFDILPLMILKKTTHQCHRLLKGTSISYGCCRVGRGCWRNGDNGAVVGSESSPTIPLEKCFRYLSHLSTTAATSCYNHIHLSLMLFIYPHRVCRLEFKSEPPPTWSEVSETKTQVETYNSAKCCPSSALPSKSLPTNCDKVAISLPDRDSTTRLRTHQTKP